MHAAGLGDAATTVLSSKADKEKKKNKNKTVTSELSSSASPSAEPVAESTAAQPIKVQLAFKRNIFDPRKQMLQ